MTGLRRYDIGFGIGHFDGRKKPILYVEKGNHAVAVGQLKSEKSAERFMAVLGYVCFGEDEDKVREMLREMEG